MKAGPSKRSVTPTPAETTYVELTVDYHPCPLVRMSGELGASKLECCGTGDTTNGRHYVKFIVRKEGHASKPEEVEKWPNVEERYEGDTFYAYRLYTPTCEHCFFPLLHERRLVPLKAVATRNELHIATLVDDFETFKGLLGDMREKGTTPRVTLLTHSASAPTDVKPRHPALDELTPRQQEVLEAAYRAGYFHGKELEVGKVAQELGMSQSTFYSHLRLASHKVLQHVLARNGP